MNDDFEYQLTPDQWEALKNLRSAASRPLRMNRFVIEGLIALGLVAVSRGVPLITARGTLGAPASRVVQIGNTAAALCDVG